MVSRLVSRHNNLSNKTGDPALAAMTCTVVVHFEWGARFPKRKFQDWLESLPEDAKIRFTGISNGKPYFEATWKEERA